VQDLARVCRPLLLSCTWHMETPPPPPPGRGGVGGGLKGSAALPSCDTSVSSNASWFVIEGAWGGGETIAGGRPRLPGASCMLILGEEHTEAELKLIQFAPALRDRARPASTSK
jgi:hypothetical protein